MEKIKDRQRVKELIWIKKNTTANITAELSGNIYHCLFVIKLAMRLKVNFDIKLEKKEAIYGIAVLILIILVIKEDIVDALAYIVKLASK